MNPVHYLENSCCSDLKKKWGSSPIGKKTTEHNYSLEITEYSD